MKRAHECYRPFQAGDRDNFRADQLLDIALARFMNSTATSQVAVANMALPVGAYWKLEPSASAQKINPDA